MLQPCWLTCHSLKMPHLIPSFLPLVPLLGNSFLSSPGWFISSSKPSWHINFFLKSSSSLSVRIIPASSHLLYPFVVNNLIMFSHSLYYSYSCKSISSSQKRKRQEHTETMPSIQLCRWMKGIAGFGVAQPEVSPLRCGLHRSRPRQ